MPLSATGIGSGLDIEGLVTQLISAERSPVENRLLNQEAQLTAKLSAYGTFQGVLSSFQTSLGKLNSLSTFNQRNTSSSDADIAEFNAKSTAESGNYNLTVDQLAASHALASGSFSSKTDVVGTGSLTIRFGTTDYVSDPESYNGFTVNGDKASLTINLDSSNNSLEGVRDAINAADAGVGAVIINDGSGYRLLLSSDETGQASSLEVTVSDTGDGNNIDTSGLSRLAFNSSATNLEQTVAAQDAIFAINGLSITSSTNTVEDLIDGVTLTLKGTTETPVNLSVSEDTASVEQSITAFVEGYNKFISTVNTLTAYNPETQQAGALQGDASVRAIVGQVRQLLTQSVPGGNGPFSSLSEIGITTQADGTLNLDTAKLEENLASYFDDVVGLFAAVAAPSDKDISFSALADTTTVGNYALNITQLASKGVYTGSATGFPVTIDSNNDSFAISVNGIESSAISLLHGTYSSGPELAAALQASINGDDALRNAGVTVEVSYETDHLVITSNSYGSNSKVSVTSVDTNTLSSLGLGVGSGVAGNDVQGTINGEAATGTGQVLIGAVGTATEGLRLIVSGGALGDRGTVNVTRGIANQLNTLISSYLGADSLLETRTEGLQSRVDEIADSREVLDRRMEQLETRYRAQFNALDTLLAQLQSTSSYLEQQLDNLPKPGLLNNSN